MKMNRRSFLASLAAAGVAQSARFALPAAAQSNRFFAPANRPVPGIIDIGSIQQAFLDDYLIHEASLINPFVTRPTKYAKNPILVQDKDWELGTYYKGIEITGQTVIYDAEEKIFKMWYLGCESDESRAFCLAISSDGYHWEKPDLGIYEYKGSRKNNMLGNWSGRKAQFFNVFKDPQESNPARRYKALGEMEGPTGSNTTGGVCIAFSPDGLHWTPYEGNPVIKHSRNLGDAPTMLGWDPRIKKYVGYCRPGHGLAPEFYGIGDHGHIRSYGYAVSDDFVKWEPTELMMTPNFDDDRSDYQYMQFTAGIDGQFYIGFNAMHETHEQTWDVFLMSSRDGFHWNWVDRKVPFLGRGEIGSYDAGYMTPSGPIIHDGKVWIYYGAFAGAHSLNPTKLGDDIMTVALCTLPENRWVGMLAGPNRGTLVTRPVLFKGTKLMVDIEASVPISRPGAKRRADDPDFRAAIEDISGGRIEGFTVDRSKVLNKSGPQELSWGDSDVGKLAGKPVRLRFEYRNAALHSFQFT